MTLPVVASWGEETATLFIIQFANWSLFTHFYWTRETLFIFYQKTKIVSLHIHTWQANKRLWLNYLARCSEWHPHVLLFIHSYSRKKKTSITAKLNIDQKLQLAAGDAERQLVLICSYSIPAQLLNAFYKTKLYINVFYSIVDLADLKRVMTAAATLFFFSFFPASLWNILRPSETTYKTSFCIPLHMPNSDTWNESSTARLNKKLNYFCPDVLGCIADDKKTWTSRSRLSATVFMLTLWMKSCGETLGR